MAQTKNVFCVLSDEQYADYQREFATLAGSGAHLIHESSAGTALTNAPNFHPSLLIVGMDLGGMEGFEFMAFLMNQHPALQAPVVLLPDKTDDLRPVLHARDQASGKSSVDEVDFERIAALIERLPSAEPPEEKTPSPAAPPVVETAPSPGGKSKAPLAIVAVVVVAGLAVGGYLVFGGGDAPSAAVESSTPKVDDRAEAQSAKADTTAPEPEPAKADEPAAPEQVEVVLPLRFRRGGSSPSITDEDELEKVVAAVNRCESKIEIAGHTSADGETVENLQLGIQRAKAAMKILVRRGIAPERFEIASRGERAPAASNETADGRRLNRRVTIEYQPSP